MVYALITRSPLTTLALPVLLLLTVAMGTDARAAAAAAFTADDHAAYRWFALPIDVSAGAADAEFLPVSIHVDFSALLKQLGAEGVVDTRALRLYRLAGDGEREVPMQFVSDPQPRPKNPSRLSDTPGGVSYLAEYASGVTPGETEVAGELAWVAATDAKGAARYRMEFGVRRDGIVVQVPYPPQDLRVFDPRGRATPPRHFPRMRITPDRPIDGQVILSDGDEPVTTYHLGPDRPPKDPADDLPFRRPFFYPVLGPGGVPLTDFGKPHDPTGSHAHHYSLWIAHNSVAGFDFWGERGGVIVNAGLRRSESGPVFCDLVQETRWVNGGADVLRERRRMVLYHAPEAFRVLDVELELTPPPGDNEVLLGKSSFGFLAARVAQSMNVFDGGGEIRNSRGDVNERGAHLKHADWIDQSGPVKEGAWAGISLMDHPSNSNHPTLWHCRNDGWACASFTGNAAYTIKPKQPLRLRYRVLLHRGNVTEGEVARRYAEYASSPVVRAAGPVQFSEK